MNKKKKQVSNTNDAMGSKQNTKKSGYAGEKDGKSGKAMFKSEFSLILLGAGLVTLIVFFIFFNPSVNQKSNESKNNLQLQDLEKRITKIETTLRKKKSKSSDIDSSGTSAPSAASPSIELYKSRVERVEAALSVKFDTLSKRLDTITHKLAVLSKKINNKTIQSTIRKTIAKSKTKKIKSIIHKPIKTKVLKKTQKKSSIFHTVKKGETLYGISRKYSTTVSKLRLLNKLNKKSEIYPGEMILVK